MTRKRFERLVEEALATIPRRFRDAIQNVAVIVEDEPPPEVLADMDIEPPDTLFGLYQGTPLPDRGWASSAGPDRISIYQGPIEDCCDTEDDIVVTIGETVIHEFGHYFGLSEDEIEAIEERYWRGDPDPDDVDDDAPGGAGLRARKRFAQHYLESAWAHKVAAAIAPSPRDVFVEIGPGQGAITRVLAGTARHVSAVEIDRDLVAELRADAPPTLEVIEADVLPFDLGALVRRLSTECAEGGPVRLAGNLPYNISSPILFKLLDTARETHLLSDATLLLQHEVADRIVGEPGTKAWGPLAIAVQLAADARRVLALPPGAFRPAPKVRSALVRLTFRPAPVQIADRALFDALVRSVFTQRRKTLGNAIRPFAGRRGAIVAPVLARAGIDPRRRPETLSLGEFSALTAALAEVTARD